MYMWIEQLIAFMLLIGATVNALADSAAPPPGLRDAVPVYYLRGTAPVLMPPVTGVTGRQLPPQSVPAHSRGFALPDTGGYDVQANSGTQDARRPGRMTAEERRTLRRQIGEVGHDLYSHR